MSQYCHSIAYSSEHSLLGLLGLQYITILLSLYELDQVNLNQTYTSNTSRNCFSEEN